jgi:hypothetical protein
VRGAARCGFLQSSTASQLASDGRTLQLPSQTMHRPPSSGLLRSSSSSLLWTDDDDDDDALTHAQEISYPSFLSLHSVALWMASQCVGTQFPEDGSVLF